MKQQLHSSSYQQLGARKKVDKIIDSSKKQNQMNQSSSLGYQQGQVQGISVDPSVAALMSNQQQQYNQIPHQQNLNQFFNKNALINGMSLEQLISNQTNQLEFNYLSQQRCSTQPSTTPITQTAQKNKKSRSPSYKSGSQIKLQSAQLENIQKQFNRLLEKENKQLNNSNSNSSANKSYLQQQQQQSAQLASGGSVAYLNQLKTNNIQRRQHNLTQLNINTNNSMNKGTSSSLTRINRSLTPNSRNSSASLHGPKGGVSQNLLQFSSGNQTTANITQKHYDFKTKTEPQQQQKKVSQSAKQMNQYNLLTSQQQQQQASQQQQKSQLQKNSIMFNNSQQSNSSVNGEVINNKLASVIQKNPQSIEEYSIKDKQLNKLLQQLLQQRMKQQQQLSQLQQSNSQGVQKNLENSISPTMSLMSSKPSTLQSYYTHLGLNNNAKISQYQVGNSTNSLQGYSFLNNSTQAGSSTQNANQTLSNGNQTLQSNQYNSNNPNQLQHNQSSLSAQLQARNIENHNIFQEQIKIEESFQQRYQQYKEKFSVYQSESQNNSKMANSSQKDTYHLPQEQYKHQEESVNLADSVQGSAPNLLKIQNQLHIIDEDSTSLKQEEGNNEKQSNYNTGTESQYTSNGYTFPQSINNPKELLSPDDEPTNTNYQSNNHNHLHHQNPHLGSNMAPMTINTESDSVQLMSDKERENMMKYIENAQFPHSSTNYQDLIQTIPNDIHQEIIIIYEDKIKEITEKFQHRDVILRQSLMKLEKENSILLGKIQDQQEEIFRYKKLREMETKLIKKLEGEIKLEKMKYQKLFQQKVYKKGNDKGFNVQVIEELNKKINEMQQEKECLEYLLKDALLKTELLKAKESVIYRQVPFSNNLNTSTSTLSVGGNQTGSNNMNQLFQYVMNSSQSFNHQNAPVQQAEVVNLLSLDNSLNKSNIQNQQQQQQQQNQQLITLTSDNDHSPDKNFLRMRNRSYGEGQYLGQHQLVYPQDKPNIQNQMYMQDFDQLNLHQYQQGNNQNEQNSNQMHFFNNKEIDQQSSERSNFMKAYQQSSNNNTQNDQLNNIPSYPPNYILRKSSSNQNTNQNNQHDEGQNSELRMGSYMMRSSSQNQQMQPEDYFYSENDQHEDYEQQQQEQEQQMQYENPLNLQIQQLNQLYYEKQQIQQQNHQQKPPIYFEINQQDNIQNFEFNNANYIMNHYQDIRNSQQLQISQQILEIRSPSNSQGNNNITNNINHHNNFNVNSNVNNENDNNDMLILERNEKSTNKSYLINNSQIIQEEASSAGNTTQNNDNIQNGSSVSQNHSGKHKLSSHNLDSSSAIIEVNVNENVNHDIFQKSDNSKIFVDNENLSKSDNLEQDQEIEAEFKDISESNRRRNNSSEDKNDILNQPQSSVCNEHEVQSLTEEYLKNKVEILNNSSFHTSNINQQNVNNYNPQQICEVIQEIQQKDEEDEAIIKYYNTKNLYLQKYYASQNASSVVNSKSQTSSNPPNEMSDKNEKLNKSSNNSSNN